jgi:hypothetical protein
MVSLWHCSQHRLQPNPDNTEPHSFTFKANNGTVESNISGIRLGRQY